MLCVGVAGLAVGANEVQPGFVALTPSDATKPLHFPISGKCQRQAVGQQGLGLRDNASARLGHVLQSPLTRAVIFSALTTATAFGSLWLSSRPGMSSMGKLLALSLVCTLGAAVLFQPVLMGPPREARHS